MQWMTEGPLYALHVELVMRHLDELILYFMDLLEMG